MAWAVEVTWLHRRTYLRWEDQAVVLPHCREAFPLGLLSFLVFEQDQPRPFRQRGRSLGVLCLGVRQDKFPAGTLHGLRNGQRAGVEVEIRPAHPE